MGKWFFKFWPKSKWREIKIGLFGHHFETVQHFILFYLFFAELYMFYRAYLYGANFIAKFRWESGFLWVLGSGGIKGGGAWGHFLPASLRLCPPPPLAPQPVEKMVKLSHFGQIFGFFPFRNVFSPLMPHKKICGAATGPRNPPWAPTGVKVPWSLKC